MEALFSTSANKGFLNLPHAFIAETLIHGPPVIHSYICLEIVNPALISSLFVLGDHGNMNNTKIFHVLIKVGSSHYKSRIFLCVVRFVKHVSLGICVSLYNNI
jgi:hypothetical protein